MRLETAAAVLSAEVFADDSVVAALRNAREKATQEEMKEILDHALALALLVVDQGGEDLLEVGSRVQARRGDDSFVLTALDRLARYDELLLRLDDKLKQHPEEIRIAEERADLLSRMGKLDEAAFGYEQLLMHPDAGATLFEQAARLAIARGAVDARTVLWAQRAVRLTESSSELPLRTLAMVLAETGRLREAHQAAVQAMESRRDRLPRPEDWYVFGRIAEQVGLPEAAREYYERVEPPQHQAALPTGPWRLAERRLHELDAPPATAEP